MKQLYQKIKSISFGDWLFFVKALFLTCFLRISLKTGSFKGTLKFLSKFESKNPVTPQTHHIEQFRRMMSWTYYFSPMLNCLAICTTYWWLLKRRGIDTDLKFGMAKINNKLIAHSWLEYKGKHLTYERNPLKQYIAFEQSIL